MTHEEAMAAIAPTGLIDASRESLAAVKPILDAHPELIAAMNALAPKAGAETPQRAAARCRRLDILQYFLDQGVQPDLFSATALGNVQLVDAYLTAHPREVNAKGAHGIALMVHANTPQMVETLLKHGADPTISLAQLSWAGRVELIEVALAHGGNLNPPGEGRHPLHIVAAQGHLQAVELFLKHGADPNVRSKGADWERKNALALAIMGNHTEVAALLRKHTAVPAPQPRRPGGNARLGRARPMRRY
jgi:ankyrin repeat protein